MWSRLSKAIQVGHRAAKVQRVRTVNQSGGWCLQNMPQAVFGSLASLADFTFFRHENKHNFLSLQHLPKAVFVLSKPLSPCWFQLLSSRKQTHFSLFVTSAKVCLRVLSKSLSPCLLHSFVTKTNAFYRLSRSINQVKVASAQRMAKQ